MRKILSVLALVMFTYPAFAQDEGLYDPVAPEGSAFVRFINNGAKAESLESAIRGKSYDSAAHGTASAYVPVKSGLTDIRLGEFTTKADLEKAGFYTVILREQDLKVLEDQPVENSAKALIAFYNLTDKGNLSLKTADGKTEVVAPVASGQSGYRSINGVKVELAVYEGGTRIAAPVSVDLKRGQAMTVIVKQGKEGVVSEAVLSRTDTTQ